MNPGETPADALQRALVLHQAGKIGEAQTVCRAIVAVQPRNFEALHLLGLIALQQGDPPQAIRLIDESVTLEPSSAAAHCNLGSAWKAAGDLAAARASYEQAIALDTRFAQAWHNLGVVLIAQGELDAALTSHDKAMEIAPDYVEAHGMRGNVLRLLQRPLEAIAAYDRALALRPHDAAILANRGSALFDLGRYGDALESLDAALRLGLDHGELHKTRAQALVHLNRFEAAVEAYERALTIDPGNAFTQGTLLFTRMRICDWRGYGEAVAAVEAGVGQGARVTLPWPALIFSSSPDIQAEAARIYAEAALPAHQAAPSPRPPDGKIRIGYYSADFHDHATAWLLIEALEAHDTAQFELHGFSFGPDQKDSMRRRLTSAMQSFTDIRAMADAEVARLSREKGIDIAIDLKGYTQNARSGLFAHRCAPVQVNFLGYPGTLGSPLFDYIVADKTVLPEEAVLHFAEQPVWLPHCYQPNDSARRISGRKYTRKELGLPEQGFVFACFNNNFKITPALFDIWMRILGAVEGSVLWLLQDNPLAADNLRREARTRGIDSARLIFAPRLPLAEHLARHQLAGLFLDTLPCNAHTTASDALWAGLPVLTCMGETFAGRVAASLLHTLGLDALVAPSLEEYELSAVELARDPQRLAALASKLAGALRTTPLFDGKLYAGHLEAAYRAMYERCLAGLPPQAIEISA